MYGAWSQRNSSCLQFHSECFQSIYSIQSITRLRCVISADGVYSEAAHAPMFKTTQTFALKLIVWAPHYASQEPHRSKVLDGSPKSASEAKLSPFQILTISPVKGFFEQRRRKVTPTGTFWMETLRDVQLNHFWMVTSSGNRFAEACSLFRFRYWFWNDSRRTNSLKNKLCLSNPFWEACDDKSAKSNIYKVEAWKYGRIKR